MKTMKYAPVVSYDSETEKWGIFSHDEKRMIALCDSKADAQDVCRIFREHVKHERGVDSESMLMEIAVILRDIKTGDIRGAVKRQWTIDESPMQFEVFAPIGDAMHEISKLQCVIREVEMTDTPCRELLDTVVAKMIDREKYENKELRARVKELEIQVKKLEREKESTG